MDVTNSDGDEAASAAKRGGELCQYFSHAPSLVSVLHTKSVVRLSKSGSKGLRSVTQPSMPLMKSVISAEDFVRFRGHEATITD